MHIVVKQVKVIGHLSLVWIEGIHQFKKNILRLDVVNMALFKLVFRQAYLCQFSKFNRAVVEHDD
ncbi:MAG: hypothetical protein DDT30_00001 [Dehalococcoidia bacterium]|nr:hypothetical protein [Bacillota bacterium]MBT9144072.1 hypothetical protein [Bacillota bacterium]